MTDDATSALRSRRHALVVLDVLSSARRSRADRCGREAAMHINSMPMAALRAAIGINPSLGPGP